MTLTCLQVSNSVSVNMWDTVVFKLSLQLIFDAVNTGVLISP